MELKQANAYSDPILFDQLNRLASVGNFRVYIAQAFLIEEAAQAREAMNTSYLVKIVLRINEE